MRLIDTRGRFDNESETPIVIGKGPYLMALSEAEAEWLFDALGAALIAEVTDEDIEALLKGQR